MLRETTSATDAVATTAASGYWGEFRSHWRATLAATAGLSAGMSLNAYINSVFAPYLLSAFSWNKAQFALMGTLSLLTLVSIPFVGRMADVYGVRRVAAVGIIAFPLTLLWLSTMTGDIRVYYAITVVQILSCTTTTTTVYCRVVAERFVASRGLALALCASGPSIVGAIGSPLLTEYMDVSGWRAGYVAVMVYSVLLGALTFVLLPKDNARAAATQRRSAAAADYASIVRSRAFWILAISSLLCSLPHALAYSQVKVMLLEHDVTSTQAGFMVSVFAAGVIVGRFTAGIALDRLPTYLVAAVGMGLPCIGLFILASDVRVLWLLALAVALLGLSFGAEADILGYAAAQYFDMRIYGTVLGLLTAAVGGAITLGSTLLSLTLWRTDSFQLFMIIAGVAVLIGSVNFLTLKRVARSSGVGI